MTAYTNFIVAGDAQPLTTVGSNPLLQDADRALYHGLSYWQWIVQTYPGPRLVQAAAALSIPSIAVAVGQAYPWDPGPEFKAADFKFPLLCAWRTSTTYRKKTAGWYDDLCSFVLMYCLPPLRAGQCEGILPILRSVEQAIRNKSMFGFDPNYTPPGGTAGASPWGLAAAGIEELTLDRGSYGVLPDMGNLWFPCLRMEGSFVERDMYVGGQTKFAGGDVQTDLVAPDGTSISPFVQAATQQAPTVTGASASTGSIAGGTSVTLAGTLFLKTPAVIFGSTPATSVTWNSATSVTCVSPAVSGPGSLPIVVVNRDGQASAPSVNFVYTAP